MAKLILKTKLEHSNPSIMRTIEIDDRRSVNDLLSTILLVYRLQDEEGPARLLSNEAIQSKEKKLRDLLTPARFAGNRLKAEVFVNTVTKGYYGLVQLGTKGPVAILISILTTKEEWENSLKEDENHPLKDSDEPKLIDYRQIHPFIYGCSMKDINSRTRQMMENGSCYLSSYVGSVGIDSYLVKADQINKALHTQITLGRKPIHFEKENCHDLSDLLESCKVNDLKALIEERNMPIRPNQKKANLIMAISDYITSDSYLKEILDSLSLTEYEKLLELCQNTKICSTFTEYDFPTLQSYNMLAVRNGEQVVIPTELLNWLENYLTENGDEELLLTQKADAAVSVCNKLYGVYTKDMYLAVAKVLFDNGSADPQMLDRTFADDRLSAETINGFRFYDALIPKQIAAGMADSDLLKKGSFYLPSKNEILQLLREGHLFTNSQKLLLQKDFITLSRYVYIRNWREGQLENLFSFLNSGFQPSDYLEEIISRYHIPLSRAERARIEKDICSIVPNVRQNKFAGFTQEEMNSEKKQPIKASKKPYPNDPCPCGSGKKYKFCHGGK